MDPSSLVAASVDLLLGSACVGCARPGPLLCAVCTTELQAMPVPVSPDPCPAGLPTAFAVAEYGGAAKAAILAHKEQARFALAKPLGRALALSVCAVLAASSACRPHGRLVVVPPPGNPATARERGHEPMERVARACVRSLRDSGVSAEPSAALRRRRQVADQAGLTSVQRSRNLTGAYAVSPRTAQRLSGCSAVIVDDVMTTGSTAAEANRALSAAGVTVLGIALIAATRRRGTGRVTGWG